MRMRRGTPDPEVRVGICCGCRQDQMTLFKLPHLDRYRCGTCFETEAGYRHHLSGSPGPKSILVLP